MIRTPFLQHHRIIVLGLGKSGIATARSLAASGARVTVWDDKDSARAAAAAENLSVENPLDEAALDGVDLIVWSPGIPHTHPTDKAHPLAALARQRAIPILCDVELLARAKPNATYQAITGTNGKSTTTTLLAHVQAVAGRDVAAGGNLGTAALDLPDLPDSGRYILELSSYQLELTDNLPLKSAVLLNITPDHLARHGGLAGYIHAKSRLFSMIRPDGVAVIGVDDDHCAGLADMLEHRGRRVCRISVEQMLMEGISAHDGILRDDGRPICDLTAFQRLPGRHNWQNACAVYALARADGIDAAIIVNAFASYPGLAHRQEVIAELNGVLYVNDSKATNADATEKALLCYQSVYWILGGQAKEGGIASLEPHFSRIQHAFLIGEAADDFATSLDGKVPYTHCGELVTAVSCARAMATPGSVVLLSPACASWDQFKSFEHRGDVFRELVEALA